MAMPDLAPLRTLALRHVSAPVTRTALPRVGIVRYPEPTEPLKGMFRPMMCMVLQGAKEAIIGAQALRYDEASYFVASLDLPASAHIVRASPEKPYVCLSLELDLDQLAALLPEVPPQDQEQTAAFAVTPVTEDVVAAWLRLLGLLDKPEDIAVLAPLYERELLYRLLQGPRAAVLRQLVQADSRLSRVARAITWLKAHFQEPMRVEHLAELAGMSPASFHRHFKAATAMSPLQYQKHLRLQEARRLLLADQDAARTAFAVGYESPSQFSREYARLFGLSPARDARRLKGVKGYEAAVVG